MEKEIRIFDEAFYHFVWQHKLYNTHNLQTTSGLPIEVIHSGLHNTDAGPDFFNAKIKIGNVLWAGNVEIHLNSSDWLNHNHQDNKAYDNVILHVVENYNKEIVRTDGSQIPTLILKPLSYVFDNYEELQQDKNTIACHKHVKDLDHLQWINYGDRLISERLENKSKPIIQKLEQSHNDWEEIFFQTLCRSFGFGINADAFERLGQSISIKIISKHKGNLLQLEALLFGQAGLLDNEIYDEYYRKLRAEYKFLKSKYNLNSLEKHNWKFHRLRPGNFPTIRIAQLSFLLNQNDKLLHSILESDVKGFEKLFKSETSEYWTVHYTFGKTSPKRSKQLGKTAAHSILINSIVPFLFCYGKSKGINEFAEKAYNLLELLPPEENHIVKEWKRFGLAPENAYDSQAQIQLYKIYCQHKKCIHCKIGHQLLSLHK